MRVKGEGEGVGVGVGSTTRPRRCAGSGIVATSHCAA